MSSGAKPTKALKATLFDQFGDVIELTREGHRDPQDISRILQGIIADDLIEVRPRPRQEKPEDTIGEAVAPTRLFTLTASEVAKAWGVKTPQDAAVPYSEAVLEEAAEDNRTKNTDWRLVYCLGQSLRVQREKLGTNRDRQPCFDPDYIWWLGASEDEWATVAPPAGYYLIDFNGRWGRTSWNRQQELIAELGPEYERTPEAVIAEAVASIFRVTGERLLENWYHWGPSRGSDGGRVGVGGFGRGGLGVGGDRPDWGDLGGNLRVCLLRKFQG